MDKMVPNKHIHGRADEVNSENAVIDDDDQDDNDSTGEWQSLK